MLSYHLFWTPNLHPSVYLGAPVVVGHAGGRPHRIFFIFFLRFAFFFVRVLTHPWFDVLRALKKNQTAASEGIGWRIDRSWYSNYFRPFDLPAAVRCRLCRKVRVCSFRHPCPFFWLYVEFIRTTTAASTVRGREKEP